MAQTDYDILEAPTVSELVVLVKAAQADGWDAEGNVIKKKVNPYYNHIYTQTVVKPE